MGPSPGVVGRVCLLRLVGLVRRRERRQDREDQQPYLPIVGRCQELRHLGQLHVVRLDLLDAASSLMAVRHSATVHVKRFFCNKGS